MGFYVPPAKGGGGGSGIIFLPANIQVPNFNQPAGPNAQYQFIIPIDINGLLGVTASALLVYWTSTYQGVSGFGGGIQAYSAQQSPNIYNQPPIIALDGFSNLILQATGTGISSNGIQVNGGSIGQVLIPAYNNFSYVSPLSVNTIERFGGSTNGNFGTADPGNTQTVQQELFIIGYQGPVSASSSTGSTSSSGGGSSSTAAAVNRRDVTAATNVAANDSVWCTGGPYAVTLSAGSSGGRYQVSNLNASGGASIQVLTASGAIENAPSGGLYVAPGQSYTFETDGTNFDII